MQKGNVLMTKAQKDKMKKVNAAPKGKKTSPAAVLPVPETDKKSNAGRPLKYTEAEQMQKKINDYFMMCDPHAELTLVERWDKDKKGCEIVEETRLSAQVPYTITGLALALDMTREDLLRYQKKDAFYDTIKKAKLKIQQFNEQLLARNGNNGGVIFNMKNNFGYSDEQKIEHSGNVNSIHDLVMLVEKEQNQEAE